MNLEPEPVMVPHPPSVRVEPNSGRLVAPSTGVLIVNADDWGRCHENTQRTLECFLSGTVSSVSAMLFMEDSIRAAEVARARGIDAGLHLNLTTPFSQAGSPPRLIEHQHRLSRFLGRHRLAWAVFHPGLTSSFEYVVAAQLDEFRRVYGTEPNRIDGHHHMHLCANVLLARLLPAGTIVRRNFSFCPGEKGFANRLYRRALDGMLARRHHLADFFFSLPPLEPASRLRRIFSLARQFAVELETHPVNPDEYRFLTGGELLRYIGELSISCRYSLPGSGHGDRIRGATSNGRA